MRLEKAYFCLDSVCWSPETE
ncbi:protein of unknown function [Methylocella tundrae]|uniref:Uncharacterized protein n=1 Tax=Methylocella tundrae TaxID=227605 RepID=A0A4U8YVE9_METTU|nr:protein of unknown function [Methylocella tundrae]